LKKTDIIKKTAIALFTTRGFHGTPTSMIAREAGVSTGTLFHYFKTKDELISAIITDIHREITEVLEAGLESENTNKEKIRRIIENLIGWGIENPSKLHFLDQFYLSPYVQENLCKTEFSDTCIINDIIQEEIENGIIKPFPIVMLKSILSSMIHKTVELVRTGHLGMEKEEVSNMVFDLLWEGISIE